MQRRYKNHSVTESRIKISIGIKKTHSLSDIFSIMTRHFYKTLDFKPLGKIFAIENIHFITVGLNL